MRDSRLSAINRSRYLPSTSSTRASRCTTGWKNKPLLALEQPQRVVLEHGLAALVDHLVGEAHQAAVALRGEPVLDHLGLDVDRVADARRALHVERRIEEREAGVLHGR